MAKRSCASDSDASTAYNTVFIDTSLDTHLAMIVSDADTVSDLKKKIMFEHPQCFPNTEEIKIHALKVKRKGYFYHLSDSMLVKSAFHGVKKNWFLCLDASNPADHRKNLHSCNPDSCNQLACCCITNNISDNKNDLLPDGPSKKLPILDDSSLPQLGSNQYVDHNTDQLCRGDSSREVSKDLEMEVKHVSDDPCNDTNKRSDLEIQEKCDLFSEGNEVPGTNTEYQEHNSRNGISDMQCNNSLEGYLKTGHVAKKKHKKKKKNEDAVYNCALKENNDSVCVSGKDTSQPEIIVPENSSGNAGRDVSNDLKLGNEHIGGEPRTSKRSDSGRQRKYNLCEGTEVPGTYFECKNGVGDVQCNNSLGQAAQSEPAAKKKRKIEKKNGAEDPLKENKALSCSSKETSKPETIIPENSLEDKQKSTKVILGGLSTEPLEDVRSMGTSSISGKRKKKKKSSGPYHQVVAAVPSSVKDVREESSKETVGITHKDSGRESDAAIYTGQSVQGATLSEPSAISTKEKPCDPVQAVGEVNKAPSSSLDIHMSEPNAGNEEKRSFASELAATSGVKRKSLKKHHAANVKVLPPLVAEEPDKVKVMLFGHEDVVPDNHKFETDQTDRIEEGRELSQKNDPEVMLSERCKTEMKIKEVVAPSNLLDANGVVESTNSTGKTRKKTRAKKSVGGKQVTLGMEHAKGSVSGISSSEPNNTFNGDHSSGEAKKEACILSHTERTEVSKLKTGNTSRLGADRKAEEVSGNDVESLQLAHISKTQENAENMDEKLRKKTKKNRTSTAKNLSDMPIKEKDVGTKDPISSSDKMRKVDTPSKTTKKTGSVKTSLVNQLTGSKFEPEKDIGIESAQIPSSYTLEGNSEGRSLEANVDGNPVKIGSMDDANNQMEVSMRESDGVNFGDYFVPSQRQREVAPDEVLVDKVTEAKRSDRERKAKKNTKKLDVLSLGTSPDLQKNLLKSNENKESEQKSQGGDSSTIQLQGSLSMEERNEHMPHSTRKSSKVSGNGVKAPSSHDIDQISSIPQDARRPYVVNAFGTRSSARAYLKENGEAFAASSSSSESSDDRIHQNRKGNKHQSRLDRYRVTVRKASRKNMGEVVNGSQQEKSLLATSGTIFKGGSSESSEDENGVENSDASTRTPSDNSSSSDYSEGESKANLGSPQNGSYGARSKESSGKNIIKSHSSSGPKSITMDMILRNSSRYKKAKLTASQSQVEDTESQPVDFVPDSQANL